MAVKVVKIKPPKEIIKRIVCRPCGATLEYLEGDVCEHHGTDIGGGPDGREWIICPNCNRDVIIRSW